MITGTCLPVPGSRTPPLSRVWSSPGPGSLADCRPSRLRNRQATPHFNMSAVISSGIYAQSENEITFLGNKPDQQKRLIRIMEVSGTGVPEDRIAALERQVQNMDALVRGLVEELLSLKTVISTRSRETEKRTRQDRAQEPVAQDTSSPAPESPPAAPSVATGADASIVIKPKSARQPEVPAEPAMVRIMQSDGTMKMEQRIGDQKTTDSSKGTGRMVKSTALRGKKAPSGSRSR